MTKSYKIKAYNLKTKEFVGEYETMLELAEDFDLTLEGVKSYFYRYKLNGEAKIKNHNIDTWCYLEREETKKVPNYKERCLNAIEYIKWHYDLGTKENAEFCLLRDRLLEILGANDENIR